MSVWLLMQVAFAASLTGRLVDETDGRGIEGATVEAWDPRLRGYAATTGSEGRFTLSLDSEGPWRLRAVPGYDDPHVWRMADGSADFCSSIPIWLETDVDAGEIRLPVGRSIRGIVLDEGGDPVPGATIWAQPSADLTNFDRPALSASDGSFEVVGLDTEWAGDAWILELGADGWPNQYLGAVYDQEEATIIEVGATGANVGAFDLLPGIVITGTVHGPEGPVEEGTVHVYSSSQVVTVEVTGAGNYQAIGLPPGEVIAWATSPGLAQTYFPDSDRPDADVPVLEEGEEAFDIDLFLPEESIFEFELVDAETGAPIPGLGGLLYNDARTVGFGDAADDQGILRIDRLHPGDWSLYVWGADEGYADDWIRSEDGLEAIFSIAEAVTEPVVVPLDRSARIAGRVEAEDGAPIDGIAIAAIREDGTGLATTTASDGTFALGGLAAGDWTLVAEYDAICPGDPGYVPIYWPGTPNRDWSRLLSVSSGEQRTDLLFVVPVDADLDGMADDWERVYGLDPTTDEDAYEDPDGDSYVNVDEYRMGTDPFDGSPPVEECGCFTPSQSGGGQWWLFTLPAIAAAVRRT